MLKRGNKVEGAVQEVLHRDEMVKARAVGTWEPAEAETPEKKLTPEEHLREARRLAREAREKLRKPEEKT